MRGRTLNDSFVVLDEAQNTTPEQMKMFLTRLGFGTRMVVTGDITQIDLPQGASRPAARHAGARRASTTSTSPTSRATTSSATRLVGRIVDAYTEYDERRLAGRRERDEASEFANRAERRTGTRPPARATTCPKRGRS